VHFNFLRCSALALFAIECVPGVVLAQRLTDGAVIVRHAASTPDWRLPASTVTLQPATADDTDKKDPVIAGALSFLIPGVGSFYAGNNGHGYLHLGIHIVTYVVTIGALVGTANCDTTNCVTNSASSAAIGYVVLLVNDVWSVFTAVGDAHVHNDGAAGRAGAGYFDPGVVVLGSHALPDGSGTPVRTLGIQVGSIAF
jgi:TM2 domain-containing membrane protein YozV